MTRKQQQAQMLAIECENCSHVGLAPSNVIDKGATLVCSTCGWRRF
jgi:DNA-directed RNA polymerase subunit RPC12/RpoP